MSKEMADNASSENVGALVRGFQCIFLSTDRRSPRGWEFMPVNGDTYGPQMSDRKTTKEFH